MNRDPARRWLNQAQALAEPLPAWLDRWLLPLLVGLAGVSGLLADAVGPSHRINLLAPPLLALLVWNAGVLLWLVVGSFGRSPGLIHRIARQLARPGHSTALLEARLGVALHLGAVAVALGALAAMYLRGLAFEYRAGWDSTFLDAAAVRHWLGVLLGPASALSGLALPDVARLETLRFSNGPGENAARWIHLYALTTAGLVLLPRGALAAWAAWQTHRHTPAALAPLSLGQSRVMAVLPFSYHLPPERSQAVGAALQAHFGNPVQCRLAATVPLGGEDTLDRPWAELTGHTPPPEVLVLLLALSATPERETHGAFIRAMLARCAAQRPALPCVVMIDESGFRERLAAVDLAQRLSERRAAWQQLVAPLGVAPVYVDLRPGSAAAGRAGTT